MVITFLVLIIWFGLKFVSGANNLFFQLNYNWDEEKSLTDFGEVRVDSISYNFVDIYSEEKHHFSPSNTYKLNNKDVYYFRYVYFIERINNYQFHGVEWITEIPNSETTNYKFSEIDLPLNQKDGVSTITIGDSYLIDNEAKYFRKFLAQQDEVYFKGKFNDVLNYPHEAIKINTSRSILKQIDEIENVDNYILFFGSEDKSMPFEEIKKNLEAIIQKLKNDKNAKKITFITLPPSTIKGLDDFNYNYNKVIKEVTEKSSIEIIDSYSLFKNDLQKYIRKDGFSLTKDAYFKLAQKVSEK